MAKRLLMSLLITLSFTFVAMPVCASTNVSGRIAADTTWTLAGSPYIVSGTVQVYGTTTTPVTLTIEPGVGVSFLGNAGLQIGNGTSQGALIAQGEEANPIVFASGGPSWALTFQDGTVDATTVLEHVHMQYGTNVTITSSSPTFRNVTIQDFTGYVSLTTSNAVFENVTIVNSGAYGIYLSGQTATPRFTNVNLTNTNITSHGIYGSGSPIIANSIVTIASIAGKYGLYLSNTTSALSVTNSTINNGLYLGVGNITPTITGNTFTNSDGSPLHVGANIVGQILNDNTFTGMTSAGKIEIVGEILGQDALWKKWSAPYVVLGTVYVQKDSTSAATLTIEPGVEVRFASTAGLQIGSNPGKGALIAQGTVENPIVFTRNGASGAWQKLTFHYETVDETTVLEHVTMQYSNGLWMYNSSPTIRNSSILDTVGNYGIYLSGANPQLENVTFTGSVLYGLYSASGSAPQITGGSLSNTGGHGIYGNGTGSPTISDYTVTIAESPGKYGFYWNGGNSVLSLTNSTINHGLYIYTADVEANITGNTFTFTSNDAIPVRAGANIIGQILNSNTFTDMPATGKIEVVDENITQDAVWKKWPAPYVISNSIEVRSTSSGGNPVTLTIEAGAQLRFSHSSAGFLIGLNNSYQGVLFAQGTAAEPVVFTASTTTPGSWSGIKFYCTAASASVIDHAIIEYAGYSGLVTNSNLYFSNCSPTISNSIVRHSASGGLYMLAATGTPQIHGCEFTGNNWGVYSSSSNPRIGNSRIYGNTTAGVYNANPATTNVDARGNWWNAASGPTHSSNPGGTGSVITNGVTYDPWLMESPNTLLAITNPSVQPITFNPAGGATAFTATLSATANWTIIIKNSSESTVRTFTGSGGSINQTWTGEDEQGEVVNDGTYTCQISATNGTGTAAPVKGTLIVSSLVTARISAPTNNQMFTGGAFIDVIGTATAVSNFNSYLLKYGQGDNPISWPILKSSAAQVANDLIHTWNTTSLTGAVYQLSLSASDQQGNFASVKRRVRFMRIDNGAHSLDLFSPNGDGIKDETTVSATLTYPGDWTLTIKNGVGATVREYKGSGTTLSQAWDGKNESGVVVPDGVYSWQIDATSQELPVVPAIAVTGLFSVDTTPPTASISSPVSGAAVFNTVTITGTANDVNFDYYRMEVEPVGGTAAVLADSTSAMIAQTLATWTTNDSTGAIVQPNGEYLFWLTVGDKVGNISSVIRPFTLNNLLVTDISANTHQIDTLQAGTAAIQFTVNAPATATFKMIPELQGPTGTPIYQANQNCPTSGVYSFTWDGRNAVGNVMPDEAYLYVIEVSDGTRSDTYAPSEPTGSGTISCSQEEVYYPYANDPMTVTYSLTQAARGNVTIFCGFDPFNIVNAGPYVAGSYTVDWDGRRPDGTIFNGLGSSSCTVASLLAENHLVTTGDTPKISAVKTDPYQMGMSFGQFATVRYQLSRPANVTVKLITPSGTTHTLLSAQPQAAGVQEFEWQPIDSTDPDGKKFLVSEEGDYIVLVKAVNPVTGTFAEVKANLRIGY